MIGSLIAEMAVIRTVRCHDNATKRLGGPCTTAQILVPAALSASSDTAIWASTGNSVSP
jgi:hypothetical protein